MTKQEKQDFVTHLAERIRKSPNFYVVDMGGMTVAESNKFRQRLFKDNLEVHMAKNTLIIKALEQVEGDHAGIYAALKQPSSIILAGENTKEPARVLKEYTKTASRPVLKGAFVMETAFVGEGLLDTLISLKGKHELIGEIVGLLQSPMQTVLSQLQSGSNILGGLVKTLADRES